MSSLDSIAWKYSPDPKSPEWENWAKYFITKYPDITGDTNLIERFKWRGNVYYRQTSPTRAGIVFFNTEKGQAVPVGLIVSRGEGEEYFIYHKDYIESDGIALSAQMPKRAEPIPLFPKPGKENEPNAAAFISNRTAEGWGSYLQAVSLKQIAPEDMEDLEHDPYSPITKHINSGPAQLERLLAFGGALPGAFEVMDIDDNTKLEDRNPKEALHSEAIAGRHSLSGAQPKIVGSDVDGDYSSTMSYEIGRAGDAPAKIPVNQIFKIGSVESGNQSRIIAEYLATEATRTLIPDDTVQKTDIIKLHLMNHTSVPVLALTRFDRIIIGDGRHYARINGYRHYTEMAELLGLTAEEKYKGSYWHMAKVLNPNGEITGKSYEQTKLLYKRVVGGFLVGNFDNHFKNFAVFNDTRELTPNYDIECSEIEQIKEKTRHFQGKPKYFNESALKIRDKKRLDQDIDSAMLVELGVEMGITFADMRSIFQEFSTTIPKTIEVIGQVHIDPSIIKASTVDPIREKMEENITNRWARYGNIQKEIDRLEGAYRTRTIRDVDIAASLKTSLYAQFAPEKLDKIKVVADRSGKPPPIGFIPDGVFDTDHSIRM